MCLASVAAAAQVDVHALLDVPYVAQTPELCGGAAAAMVLRYWGERNVFPEDFASLVVAGGAAAGGIVTSVLADAIRGRGWQAFVVPAGANPDRTGIRSNIDQGRPIVALIEVAPRTYHYVVIVGSTDHEVVLHDPARAPFRVMPWAEFDRAWAATGRWMMLVLPAVAAPAPDRPVPDTFAASSRAAVRAESTPCDALVDRAVTLALAGNTEEAEQDLVAASRLCPRDPAPQRELAGIRFVQSRWSEAEALARSAVALQPDDVYAWQIVATSRYLMGDTMGALDAWNRAGEPRMDTFDVHGVERTPQPDVARASGLQPRQVVTSESMGRALRRLGELPVTSTVRMTYEPIASAGNQAGGLARVDVFIKERHVVPHNWLALGTLAARVVLLHEVRVDVAGPMRAGEVESATWRWSAGRPRVSVGLALPSPEGLFGGVLSLEALWERQSYDATPAAIPVLRREERRRVALRLSDWSSSRLRWQAGAAFDRLGSYNGLVGHAVPGDYIAAESALELRLAGDRLAVAASGGWWTPFGSGDRFAAGGLLAAWRSSSDTKRAFWSTVTELSVASRTAPLAVWQGAGTGPGRPGLLRAHPLIKLIDGDGVLTGPAFGRDVARASLEYARPVGHLPAGGLAIAGFVDTARAWHRLSGLQTSPLYVDAGIGLRLQPPGQGGGVRVDIARGLRGGGTRLSASWGGAWPR